MPVGTATALVGAGALASAFGGSKKQVASENLQGYQALPKEVQDLLIQQYLPKAQATLNMPYQNIPMQRYDANPQSDPFASQGLADLQKFSDAAGGYFTPYDPTGQANKVNMPSYQGAAGNVVAQPIQPMQSAMATDTSNASIQQYLDSQKGTNGRNNEMAYRIEAMLKSGAIKPEAILKQISTGDKNAMLNILQGVR